MNGGFIKLVLNHASINIGQRPAECLARNLAMQARKKPTFNPILTMSVYSLLNAFEFFKKTEDRHRQATVILMDLAIEYVLKARLYKADPVKFLEGKLDQLDLFAALREVKKNSKISREDELKLNLIHRTRNYALHKARIPDSPTTKQHMAWTYTFIHEFALENLAVDIDSQIPVDLQVGLLLK